MTKLLSAVLTSLLAASAAHAIPLPHGPMPRIPMSFTQNYNFEGIVALSNCSGSIIALERSQPNDHALVLTNGHCLESGLPRPGTFVVNQPSSRRFNVLASNSSVLGSISATRIVYASMTKTDVTIYEVSDTYAEIAQKYKTRPLVLSNQHPAVGQALEVISGYWKRGYTCAAEAFIPRLMEGGWQWDDSLRYSRPGCEIIGGTSGSPVIAKGTRTVIAINNTINENGQKCSVNNPCEVDANGNVSYHEGYGYAQETYQIYSCINQVNQFDINLPTCQLFRGNNFRPYFLH